MTRGFVVAQCIALLRAVMLGLAVWAALGCTSNAFVWSSIVFQAVIAVDGWVARLEARS